MSSTGEQANQRKAVQTLVQARLVLLDKARHALRYAVPNTGQDLAEASELLDHSHVSVTRRRIGVGQHG